MIKNLGPIRVKTVYGEPVPVLDRTLTPVARVTAVLHHRGTIRQTEIEGRARGWAVVRPLAVVETREGAERVLPVWDVTRAALITMAVVAIAVPVVAVVLILVSRLVRRR